MPTVYRSTDTDAPVLTGLVGSLIAVLDACLVNGYTDRPAAGWTKAFSGTNKAAYKNSLADGGSECVVRVEDNEPGATDGRNSRWEVFSDMTDVDTGTNGTGQVWCYKSDTLDSTARPWVLVADGLTFTLYVINNGHSEEIRASRFIHAGDYDAIDPDNAFRYVLMGTSGSGVTSGSQGFVSDSYHISGAHTRTVHPDGVTGAFSPTRSGSPSYSGLPTGGNCGSNAPVSWTGKFLFVDVFLSDGERQYLGRLRGLKYPMQRLDNTQTKGELIAGTNLVYTEVVDNPFFTNEFRRGALPVDAVGPW